MKKTIPLTCPKCGFKSKDADAAKVHQLYAHESTREERLEFHGEQEQKDLDK